MEFKSAEEIESLTWTMRLADYPRALNRDRINSLFNGDPPYTDEQVRANNIAVNVNPLSSTNLAHQGRAQFYSAFLKPARFFSARTDGGPVHKRSEYNTIVTSKLAQIMKRSASYFETQRSKFAMLILHGIAPAGWDNRDKWCPDEIGVEDVLIPANTTLKMDNLPFFAIYRSYTGAQLRKLTSGPKVDSAWNMPLVNYMIKWVDQEGQKLMGTTWPEVWSPEKMSERMKGDGGLFASDAIPTIDTWDFYYWSDEKKQAGWRRRIILDAFGNPGVGAESLIKGIHKGANRYGDEAKGFLYNPKDRIYASNRSELVCFQFADLSAVAPFRYHSVRSLAYLIWAVCHLQNRLFCKIQEATFESLLQYFRVKTMEDVQHALKIELINRGFIDESIHFIPQAERWQTDGKLAELAWAHNQQIIDQNSSSFVQKQSYGGDNVEKRHLQVMAELNATTQLVSAGLLQAYAYQNFEYREVFRRFMRKDSKDPDVREFRLHCLKSGIPEKLLVPEAWDIASEQVMGAGNKTMEMMIAQQLLQMRNLYDPEPQRKILRDVTLAITDSAAMTEELVPDKPARITDAVHDAQLATGTLMMGLPVGIKSGINHIEYVETLLANMAMVVKRIEATGAMATQEQIIGLNNMAQHVAQHIQIIAQDEAEGERVKEYGDALKKLMNMVKAYGQRLQQAQQKAAQDQQGNGGMDPKDRAKIAGMMMTAKAKAENQRESHGQRSAERQVQAEMKRKQEEQKHQQDLQHRTQDTALELERKRAEAALDLHTEAQRSRLKATEE